MIEIRFNREQLDRIDRLIERAPRQMPKVMARAINRAIETTRTEASRKIRETYYIKAKDIKASLTLKKASAGDLTARITSRGSTIPLTKFKVKPQKPQPKRRLVVVARVKKGAGGPISGAFVAQMRSGHIGVFNRVAGPRLPITQRFGPAVPQMLGGREVITHVQEKTTERLMGRLEHEVGRVLGGN